MNTTDLDQTGAGAEPGPVSIHTGPQCSGLPAVTKADWKGESIIMSAVQLVIQRHQTHIINQ
ncbi:hypothetical protein C942_03118 [Photobacterium marinum]|uniref:Uncharacterized protein n=1 Tax=Photobacterium marinum TaxID=1056511 RepID=L8J981_9GAMM|nr:hypothetical protein C942_03118 [Photobacterium marinum]